ncbi:MAG TPA: N-6 DNA methylase [Drouetiella sp.]
MSLNPRNAHQISTEQSKLIAMMKLTRSLKKIVEGHRTDTGVSKDSNHSIADSSHSRANEQKQMILVIAAASLAMRGLMPEILKKTALGQFIRDCSEERHNGLIVDATKFCSDIISELLRGCELDSLIKGTSPKLIKVIWEFEKTAQLSDSLAAGWFKQCIIKETPRSIGLNDGHIIRSNLNDVPQLTQWFTPSWIADFLIEQSIGSNAETKFLDPACGAGHLLIPALNRLNKLSSDNSIKTRLENILDSQLYALDIDEELVSLAKFAVYLEARDLAGVCELPAPKIFALTDANGLGSLESKSLRNLPTTFDAVAMNPPYLGHRTMPQPLRDYLRAKYPNSQYDLFAAFLEMGMRLTKPGGKLSAICQQSVLTIQRYSALRKTFISEADIESVVQLGSGAFATKGGEKTNNAIVTLQKHSQSSEKQPVTCWQLLSKKEKLIAENTGIMNVPHKIIPRAEADELACALPDSPFSFWAPKDVIKLFAKHPRLDDTKNGITCTNGLFTCNNKKFVLHYSEVPEAISHEYVSYDKGGGHKWFRTSELMLHWKNNGEEIRQYRVKRGQSAKLPGEAHYFKSGVTYSYIGTRGFKARLLSPNAVFDIASSAIFSEKYDTLYILGLLNSSLTRCVLGTLNPTINFQIGDIRRLPFAPPTTEVHDAIVALVREAVAIASEVEKYDPSSPTFQPKPIQKEEYEKRLKHWTATEQRIQSHLDEIIFDHYEIGTQSRNQILVDPWVTRGAAAFAKL